MKLPRAEVGSKACKTLATRVSAGEVTPTPHPHQAEAERKPLSPRACNIVGGDSTGPKNKPPSKAPRASRLKFARKAPTTRNTEAGPDGDTRAAKARKVEVV